MAEDVNALYTSTLERAKTVRKTVEQIVEIPFWLYPDKPKWVSGIRAHTTVRDILLSLVRSDSNKMFDEKDVRDKRLVLVEQWRGVEKPLPDTSNVLKIWNAWGEEKSQVRFVVKRVSSKNVEKSTKNIEKSVKNVEKMVKNVEALAKVPDVQGVDQRRRLRRRRNSVSSAGSLGDEVHPRRLAKLAEGRSVETSLQRNVGGVDVFDEHIEEMMKIIVVQGRRICEELKRIQQEVATSPSKPSQERRTRRKATTQNDDAMAASSRNVVDQSSVSSTVPTPDRKSSQSAAGHERRISTLDNLPTLHEVSIDSNDTNSLADDSKNNLSNASKSKSLPVDSNDISLNDDLRKNRSVTFPINKSGDSKKVRILPKIPLNAKVFDINKRISDDISTSDDILNTSRDSSNASDGSRTVVVVTQRANSTLDISRVKCRADSGSNPSLNTSRDSSKDADGTDRNRTLGKRANSSLDVSAVNRLRDSSNKSESFSKSVADLSHGLDISKQNQSPMQSSKVAQESSSIGAEASPVVGSSDNWSIFQIVENLEVFSSALSNLSNVNDKLQFAEESIDRLHIAIAQQQHHLQQQQHLQQRRLGSHSSTELNADAARDHLVSARSEVERLRVINDNVGREIAENQKHLHSLDAAVKSKRSALKALEYDVNVIEKEGRKLAKELDKVMNIRIEGIFTNSKSNSEPSPSSETEDTGNDSVEIETELDVLATDSGNLTTEKCLSGQSSFDPAGRTSVTGTPESSSSGNSSGSSSEKSVRFCLDPPLTSSSSTSGRCGKSSGKMRESSGDNVDNNSDTGLSSLHSSSDEGTYEIGTLV